MRISYRAREYRHICLMLRKSSNSHHLNNGRMFFREEKKGEGKSVVAADVNKISWLVDFGLSFFVTVTTDGLVYA